MAVEQPTSLSALNVPSHSNIHRVIAADVSATAKTVTVDSGDHLQNALWVGPDMAYTTIDAAINAASAGDTILVSEGTYTETITYDVDNLTIKAIGSKLNTTITQAAATVVDFSTKEGCVLEGFTITVSAADTSAGDFCISGANDTANNTANTIHNCDINWSSSATLGESYATTFTDGDWDIINCNFDVNQTATASTTTEAIYNNAGAGILNIIHCNFDVDSACTTTGGLRVIHISTGSTVNIWDCDIQGDSAITTTGVTASISSNDAATVNIYNSYMHIKSTSTGITNCYEIDGVATWNSYNNTLYANNSDGDEKAYNVTSGDTLNAYGDKIKGGTLTNAGTMNIYGVLPATDVGYQARSDGTTGGTGSAATGKNYVNVVINGVTHKLFYDTAA